MWGCNQRISANLYFDTVYILVEQVTRPQQEFINMELLNEQLPRPGDPGAPCLPSEFTSYLQAFNGKWTGFFNVLIVISCCFL